MTRLHRLLLILTALLGLGCRAATGEPLTVRSLAERILANDPTVRIADQTLRLTVAAYAGTVAKAKPQLTLNSGYGLRYTPSSTTLTTQTTPPYLTVEDTRRKASHSVTAGVAVSQLLPTGGSLNLRAENAMDVETGQTDSGSGFASMEPLYSQSPKVSLTVTQPIFVNRKVVDLELFPATFRKARIGYLKEQEANLEARNQALTQGLSLFFSVLELRRGIAALESGLELAAGRLRNLEQSYRLGAAAETDVWELRIAAGRQQESVLELRYRLAQAEAALAQSLGADSLEAFSLADVSPALPFAYEKSAAIAEALERHPLIRQNGLGTEEKSLDRLLGGQQHASTLSLGLSVAPRYPTDRSGSTDFGDSISLLFGADASADYTVSLGLNVPLYEGGKRAADQAGYLAAEAIARQALAVRRGAVRQEVESQLIRRDNLEMKARLLEDNTELLRRRLEVEQGLLALGKSTELDVLARRVELESKQNEAWRARADLYLTVLALYRAVGRDLADIIKDQQG